MMESKYNTIGSQWSLVAVLIALTSMMAPAPESDTDEIDKHDAFLSTRTVDTNGSAQSVMQQQLQENGTSLPEYLLQR